MRHMIRLDTREEENSDELTQTSSDNTELSEEAKEKKEKAKEEKQKFAETMSLMSKYDKAEAHAKWLASPEYAKLQEEKEKK